jgi:tRNA pseudouridine55 synthase
MVESRAGGLDGVLVVAKPVGPTSHDIVGLVRRLSATRRVGHGGTLDPFASGVLPLFLGHATRLVEYHLGAPKSYRATVCFGAASTTDDLAGELRPFDASPPTRDAVAAALSGFWGEIEQVPPAFSAVHVGGRRAYAMARAGLTPVLRPRRVTIERLELLEWDGSDPARPVAVLRVVCSAGTYVRAIARDLGGAVGSAAYLGALERTSSGPFDLAEAVPLDRVRAAAAEGPAAFVALLRPIDAGLEDLPVVRVDAAQAGALAQGQAVRPTGALPSGDRPIRISGPDGRLIAIGGPTPGGRLRPVKVLIERSPTSVPA